jgi:hypothetical protein
MTAATAPPGASQETPTVRLSVVGARVDVGGPERFVRDAVARLEPFVTASDAPRRPDATWSVVHATHGDPSFAGLERVKLDSTREPPAKLWVDHERRRLVLGPDTAPGIAAHLAFRWVRILLRLQRATHPGELFLHAGMVARPEVVGGADRGVAVIGPKRAGKTSTIMAAVLAGAAFVGNDDLSVAQSAQGWTGYGWPRSIQVRPDTFAALGVAPPGPIGPDRAVHPTRSAMPREEAGAAPSVILLPRELTALLGAPAMRRGARLTGLVFPRFTEDARENGIRELSATESAARLRRDSGEPVKVKHADFLLPHFPRPPVSDTEEAFRALAVDVPGYELVQSFADLPGGAIRLKALWA